MRWGRWFLDGEHLVYCPEPGAPDPLYEIHTSELERPEDVERWIHHLRAKYWVQADDLTAFSEAGSFLVRAHIADARLLDENTLPVPQAMPWEEYRKLLAEICVGVKPVREPDAGKPHVRFDERAREIESWARY